MTTVVQWAGARQRGNGFIKGWLLLLLLLGACTGTGRSNQATAKPGDEPVDFRFPLMPLYENAHEAGDARPGYRLGSEENESAATAGLPTTFAIVAVNGDSDDQRLLQLAASQIWALQPSVVVMLGDSGTMTWDIVNGDNEPGGESGRMRLIAAEYDSGLALVAGAGGNAWLFIDSSILQPGREEEMNRELAELAESGKLESHTSVIVCVDGDLDDGKTATLGWERLLEVLRESVATVAVVVGGGERFSWWQASGIDYYSIPPLAEKWRSSNNLSSGQFNGLLWGSVHGGGAAAETSFKAITLSGILDQREMARNDQMIVDILGAGLSATAFCDTNPLTTVTLRNTTEHRLDFSARWQASEEVSADPRVVSFSLTPGQVFSQQFRLSAASSSGSLKFLSPRFVLKTEIAGPGGLPRQIELVAEPWGGLAAQAPYREQPIKINGSLEDWDQPGIQLNHGSQVVVGREAWRGPADLSGVVRVSYDDEYLYVAVRVIDDFLGNPDNLPGREGVGVHVLLNELKNQDNAAETAGPPPILTLFAEPSGTVEVRGSRPDLRLEGVRSAVAVSANGYIAEFAVPRQNFMNQRIPNPVMLDILVYDHDQATGGEPREKIMQLSGRGMNPALFALIRLGER